MIPVIDLFAGPGGLGERFSSVRDADGNPVFQTILSIERDPQTHATLRLRSFFRKILEEDGSAPREYIRYMRRRDEESRTELVKKYSSQWAAACEEAICAELVEGDDTLAKKAQERVAKWRREHGEERLVLIGGPPCQAYSLVGRSRRAHDADFDKDVKHTLYKCYLAFIEQLNPDIFVMENVKGLLSAKHKGQGVFEHIVLDMKDAGYEIRSLVTDNPRIPKDFVVEAEEYGIPQKRHRVILLGVRRNLGIETELLSPLPGVTLREALMGIPKLRSRFSYNNENWRNLDWAAYVNSASRRLIDNGGCEELTETLEGVISAHCPEISQKKRVTGEKGRYDSWYRGRLGRSKVLTDHESRSHIAKDLDRYLFCSAYAQVYGRSPVLEDFPEWLLPKHKNVQQGDSGKGYEFNDRFRVQVADKPATTITAHISKDGHYYIHPDPTQCRSLTVREAARLQTFPDDYLFEGNRTSQYTQIGNAVPPLLAQQIAATVSKALGVAPHCFSVELRNAADSVSGSSS